MKVLLLDTNVVSILFKKSHSLRQACLEAVSGQQLVISFMTRAELMLWPVANNWGESRRAALSEHIALYTTLYPGVHLCDLGRGRESLSAQWAADSDCGCVDRFRGAAVGRSARDSGLSGLCCDRRSGYRADSIGPCRLLPAVDGVTTQDR